MILRGVHTAETISSRGACLAWLLASCTGVIAKIGVEGTLAQTSTIDQNISVLAASASILSTDTAETRLTTPRASSTQVVISLKTRCHAACVRQQQRRRAGQASRVRRTSQAGCRALQATRVSKISIIAIFADSSAAPWRYLRKVPDATAKAERLVRAA